MKICVVKLMMLKTDNASVCRKDFHSGSQNNLSDPCSLGVNAINNSHNKVPFPISVPICASGST